MCPKMQRVSPTDLRDARYALVRAANHLLFTGLPLREPDSRVALATFLQAGAANPLPAADRHTVLVAALGVLNPHAGGRLPGLIDRYFAKSAGRVGRLDVFAECVEDMIRYRGIGDRFIQHAISLIESRFVESTLSPAWIAAAVNLDPSTFSRRFKQHTSLTPSEYLRNVRLDRAAIRLRTTEGSIKEVWSGVGYNDAANFRHDFHDKFGMSPREYRVRGVGTDLPHEMAGAPLGHACKAQILPKEGKTVLIVDDDRILCDTARRLLTRSGFSVLTAFDGRTGLVEAYANPVDAILLDYRLPDLDGVDFLRTLRGKRPAHKPAVAVWTADWAVEDRAAEIMELNAGIASKLCDFEELERLVRSYCDMPLEAA